MVRNIYRHRRWGQRRKKRKRNGHAYAALDLGTNNCRLLIAEATDDGFTVIDGFSRIVRLGEGVAASGVLGADAMDRTLSALRVCSRKIRDNGVKRSRCIATEACRRAANGDDFLKRVEAETGLTLETVTPATEAELTLAGCRPLLDTDHEKALLFDIGGGSTEIMWVDTPAGGPVRTLGMMSFPTGVVTLAEEFGEGILADHTCDEILERIDRLLAPFCAEHGIGEAVAAGKARMIGTSGTVTTLGAICLGLDRYDRSRVDGLSIPFDNIRAISERLTEMDMEERRSIPCVGPDRADLMLMGCAILRAICERWPVGRLCAADRGICEGLLLEMIEADRSASYGTSAGAASAPPAPFMA